MLLISPLLLLLCHQLAQAAPQNQQPPADASSSLVKGADSGGSPAVAREASSPKQNQQSAKGNASATAETITTKDTPATSTPSSFRLSTRMPPLDTNLDLLDYPSQLLGELHFTDMAPDNSDKKMVGLINVHHNHDQLYQYLNELARKYPEVTRLHSIGESVEGHKLWVLEISEHPGEHERLKPEFRYIANMHGNEVVGRELLLHLARLILENYHTPEKADEKTSNQTNTLSAEDELRPTGRKFIKKLVKSTRIHLMPTMNPDGYTRSQVACMFEEPSRRGRLNANNVDLNRNFPDQALGSKLDAGVQPEVRAVIDWSLREPFVLSANLHGGGLVANYPYDSSTNLTRVRDPDRRAPDHEMLRELALAYSTYHPTMWTGAMCYDRCTDYHNETFEDEMGTTSGAAWYGLYGGMQDWMYNNTNELHLTMELGCNQYPPAEALLQYWEMNKAPLLNYMRQVHRGIKGLIQDAQTGAYLANVKVHVESIDRNVTSTKSGDYFRLLKAGPYVVHFEHPDYHTERLHVNLGNGMAQIHNIKLRPRNGTSNVLTDWLSGGGSKPELTDELKGTSEALVHNMDDHSIVVATLVMSVFTFLLLLSMVGAYLIQKQRYHRSQSVSVELQPRSSSTGTSLPKQSVSGHHLSASTISTDISA